MSDIYQWSPDPAFNNQAPPHGSPEGMAPSTVNNSIREIMAAVKRFYDSLPYVEHIRNLIYVHPNRFDIGGGDYTSLYPSGTALRLSGSSPFVVNSYVQSCVFNSPNTEIIIDASIDNSLNKLELGIGGSAFLSYASETLAGKIELASDIEVQAGLDSVRAVTPLALSNLLLNLPAVIRSNLQQNSLPAGFLQYFAGTSVPSGWLICDGSAVSRSIYADLFSAIGTTWGIGDGSSSFNLPNAVTHNRFLRSSGGGLAVGAIQADSVGPHQHGGTLSFSSPLTHFINNGSNCHLTNGQTSNHGNGIGFETRPHAMAALLCIKY